MVGGLNFVLNPTELEDVLVVESSGWAIGCWEAQRTDGLGFASCDVVDLAVLAGFVTGFEAPDEVDTAGHIAYRVGGSRNYHLTHLL